LFNIQQFRDYTTDHEFSNLWEYVSMRSEHTLEAMEQYQPGVITLRSRDITEMSHRGDNSITKYNVLVFIRFEQAQIAFLRVVSSRTILIGHSLENDLKALKICHSRCVDTAVILPHPRGYPLRHKLRFLAKEYLHVDIQKGGSGIISGPPMAMGLSGAAASAVLGPGGHSSVEDARVALQLVRLKIEMGPAFGIEHAESCAMYYAAMVMICFMEPKQSVVHYCTGVTGEANHSLTCMIIFKSQLFSINWSTIERPVATN
jgi:hypothetical protein